MSMRPFLSVSLLLAGFTISACTAILVPNEKDDGVARCNTTEDCEDPDDNRYRSQCVFGEGQAENSDKVCAPAFEEINCSPDAYAGDHPFVEVYEDATSNQSKAAYGACAEENRGKRGCRPRPDGCDANLEEIEGICDDPNELIPAINPTQLDRDAITDVAGEDAQDQFCRFYFCDEMFVCDKSGSKPLCKPCDPNEEFGEGGCGTLYIEGQPSTIYTSLDSANCNGTIDDSDVDFGPAPMPLP